MTTFDVTMTVTLEPSWPDTTTVNSTHLPDGRIRHELADGRAIVVSEPNYELEYRLISMFGSDTFKVRIALAGLAERPTCFEAWNFDVNALRTYAFAKTIRIVHLQTGEAFTGAELQASLEQGHTERAA